MVAVAARARVDAGESRGIGWTVGALAVLIGGLGVRLVVGGAGVGDRSAMVMALALSLGAWAAARLLGGPRVAFGVMLAVVALLDLAALPQKNPPAYDDLQAFYRTDQLLSSQVTAPAGTDSGATLTVLAQPMFTDAQPQFGLAGTVNGRPMGWSCAFGHGIQTLALPLPAGIVRPAETADVQLHLSGSPSRESDYLVVYASSQRGGFLVSLVPTSALDSSVTRCALA
ncbi:MAG: hypothetical protein JO352_17910 [Chloroflexi bacterium]|nr:hypothetical protein [Chloroflexota bacterium]MBV9600010.1 hypothetical protein [Chloroflexota bacterium]